MKKKEKTKRFGIILLEFVLLIAILIGIVKLNANAKNGPDMNRIKASLNVPDTHLLLNNKYSGYMAEISELKSGIKTLSLKEVSTTLPRISGYNTFDIYAEPISLDYVSRYDWGRSKSQQTDALSVDFYSTSRILKYDIRPVREFSDSIPLIIQPLYHKYLSPQIVLGIGKK